MSDCPAPAPSFRLLTAEASLCLQRRPLFGVDMGSVLNSPVPDWDPVTGFVLYKEDTLRGLRALTDAGFDLVLVTRRS